jgi:Terpene cyclase DEP1
MVRLYAALCVLGAALPLFFFASFLADEGLDPQEFVDQATGSDIALFAWADVVVTALFVLVLAFVTRPRRWPLAAAATVLVGPSLGLPLLLLLRQRDLA